MKCTTVQLPDGARAIICRPSPRPRKCTSCGCATTPAELRECDWVVSSAESLAHKTCDRLICVGCSHSPAPDVDYCPEHAMLFKARKR